MKSEQKIFIVSVRYIFTIRYGTSTRRGDDVSMIIDAPIEENPIIEMPVGMKCGCLQILDEGHEYLQSIDLQISNIKNEKADFIKAIEDNKLVQENRHGWDSITPAYVYKPIQKCKIYLQNIRHINPAKGNIKPKRTAIIDMISMVRFLILIILLCSIVKAFSIFVK